MFAREADEAYALGPASARPYIDLAVLERVAGRVPGRRGLGRLGLRRRGPGVRRPAATRLGVTFIGPSADAMRKLGDKIGSKLIAEEVGVPVAPWSRGGVDTLEAALASAAQIGYPLMLKATAGGGGRGIRKVDSAADLEDAYQLHPRRGRARVRQRGGVPGAAGDRGSAHRGPAHRRQPRHGLGGRCARLHHPASQPEGDRGVRLAAPDPEQTDEVKASAERLAIAVGYVGAGTVEFLYHPGERTFAFLEVNTRLQVEHPITEVTTDLDLVKAQLHVAAGGRLEGHEAAREGARRRGAAQRRGPRPRLRSVARPHRTARAAVGTRHPGRHRRGRGRHDPGRLRLDDRQDHRLRPHPRRGAGPAPPGDVRDHRRDRGRRHQQELHPRPPRPVRGDRRRRPAGPTPAGSTGSATRDDSSSTSTPASPWSPPASRPTRTRPRSRSPACWRARTVAVRRCSTRSVARSTSSSAVRRTRSPSCRSARQRFRVGIEAGGVRARRGRRRRAAGRVPHPDDRRR